MKTLDYVILSVLALLQAIFMILKVANVITWNWLIVFSPILVPMTLFLCFALFAGILLLFRLR